MERGSSISEQEIAGFIDGELSEDRRVDVQAHLATDPQMAAEVFAEANRKEALRSAQPRRLFPPQGSIERAHQLEGAFRRERLLAVIRLNVAAAVIFGLGWAANSLTDPLRQGGNTVDESFILSARESLRVAQLNVGIRQGGEPKEDKIDRLMGTLNIGMPQLPSTWQVADLQVQPWNGRQGLVITAKTPTLGQVTLIAVPMNGEDAVPPTAAADGRVPTVYWQAGGTAYALMGPVAPDRLEREANGIAIATRKYVGLKTKG